MVKNVASSKVEPEFWFVRLRSLPLLMKLKRNSVAIDFSPKIISQLERKHQFITVSDAFNSTLRYLTGVNFDDFISGERIKLRRFAHIDLSIFINSLTEHELFLAVVLLVADKGLLTSLPPDSHALITTNSNEVITDA